MYIIIMILNMYAPYKISAKIDIAHDLKTAQLLATLCQLQEKVQCSPYIFNLNLQTGDMTYSKIENYILIPAALDK